MTPKETALLAASLNISVVPPAQDGSKKPFVAWKQFCSEPATPEKILNWYAQGLTGIGFVCGAVSGGLEAFEFETPSICETFIQIANETGLGPLIEKIAQGYTEFSPGGGTHWLYRCPENSNTKLARRQNLETLIETKGERGYIIVAPSYGKVHPSGRPYRLKSGGVETIVTITPSERKSLCEIARSLDEAPIAPQAGNSKKESKKKGDCLQQDRPGDDFNQREPWPALMERNGWVRVFSRGDEDFWRRPGKREGISATTNFHGSDLLYVFSSSTEFTPERGYSKFGAYMVMEHNGDASAAARVLRSNGYGGAAPRPGAAGAAAPRDVSEEQQEEWRLKLTYGGPKGREHPTESFNNFIVIFTYHQDFKGQIWMDTFRGIPMIGDLPLSDSILGKLAVWLGENERISIRSPSLIEKAVRVVAALNPRDLIHEWLMALPPWDGEERLTCWLNDISGAEKNELGMEVSRLLIVSMVARGLDPGCLFRTVIILEGPENSGKTSLLKAIGGEWYGKLDVSLESKEAYMLLRGVWISELAELDALKKSEESRLKAFITHTSDEWVPKYSNISTSALRRSIFVGTTNEKVFLKGQTGNTRFIPITTGSCIEHGLFKLIRDQLFAEALVYYRTHPLDWWTLSGAGEEKAEEAREERRISSEYEDPLRDWLNLNRPQETSFEDIAVCFLKLESPADWKDISLQRQIGAALKQIGWERKVIREGKETRRIWRKKSD